jgi:cyclopropane-fatty-acyl-phospholipid synthase
MTFRHGNQVVFQIQLAKSIDAVPLTRDYMFVAEQSMQARSARSGRRKPEAA